MALPIVSEELLDAMDDSQDDHLFFAWKSMKESNPKLGGCWDDIWEYVKTMPENLTKEKLHAFLKGGLVMYALLARQDECNQLERP
jgi:hypothetical protein